MMGVLSVGATLLPLLPEKSVINIGAGAPVGRLRRNCGD
jgi:hypothetical protein